MTPPALAATIQAVTVAKASTGASLAAHRRQRQGEATVRLANVPVPGSCSHPPTATAGGRIYGSQQGANALVNVVGDRDDRRHLYKRVMRTEALPCFQGRWWSPARARRLAILRG